MFPQDPPQLSEQSALSSDRTGSAAEGASKGDRQRSHHGVSEGLGVAIRLQNLEILPPGPQEEGAVDWLPFALGNQAASNEKRSATSESDVKAACVRFYTVLCIHLTFIRSCLMISSVLSASVGTISVHLARTQSFTLPMFDSICAKSGLPVQDAARQRLARS